MATVERTRARGRQRAARITMDLATEIREARLAAGLSQQRAATAAGISQARASRIERALPPPARFDEIARLAAVLGLELSARLYPVGSPVRDAGQLRLIARFRPLVHTGFEWTTEALVGGDGDLRAWDARLDGPGSVGIDAETRLRDVQALQRRCEAKWRDSGVDRVVLLVAKTRHNRAVLTEHREALRSTFPADTHAVLMALRRGRLPGTNGIVML